jgi:hypothetical protein
MTIKYKTRSFLQGIGRVPAFVKNEEKKVRKSNLDEDVDDGPSRPRARVKITDKASEDEKVAIEGVEASDVSDVDVGAIGTAD